jgi:hypothetical protein
MCGTLGSNNPSPNRWKPPPSRLLGSWTAPYPSLLVVIVVVIPIDDLNDDRSLRAMSVIADHVVRGTPNSPLRSGQTTTTTSEGTSRHAVVVTRAYEPHPAMINPLDFGHQQPQPQPQRTLYSQSPPNYGPSSGSNNPSDNIRPQCMPDKYQDQPRCVPRIVAGCIAHTSACSGLFPSSLQYNPSSLALVLSRPLHFRLTSPIGMS